MICLISLPDYAVQNGFHDILRYIVYWTHHKQGKSEGFDSWDFSGGEHAPVIPGARATYNYTHLARCQCVAELCVFFIIFFMMSSEHEETHTDCTLAQYPQ